MLYLHTSLVEEQKYLCRLKNSILESARFTNPQVINLRLQGLMIGSTIRQHLIGSSRPVPRTRGLL
jgi:hypothetical protein